jgi:hypothetical protein
MTLLSILLISLNLHLGSDTTKIVKHSCCKSKQTKACAGMLVPSDTTKTSCKKPKKKCCKTKSPK